MGLAASQARFLALTARKSNIEYQGQQINQQRTVLANKVSATTNEMLSLNPPTPPSSTNSEYYQVSQTYTRKETDGSATAGREEKITGWEQETMADGKLRYKITYSYMQNGETRTGTMYTVAVSSEEELNTVLKRDDATGDIIESMQLAVGATETDAGTAGSTYTQNELAFSTTFDDKKFNDAMNLYDYEKYKYEAKLQQINNETADIQRSDKNLELRLRQLDTEHNAVQVEMDAVKSVISKNVEATFKIFS